MVAQKVAVIGGGMAGLASIKSCLDAGLQPTCFEKRSWLGGLWNYCEEILPDVSTVHHNTETNTCKEMMCFSDFPVPKEYPNYMSHRQFLKYLESYAEHFDLVRYMQFDTVVEKLARSKDHADTGRWVVSYRKVKETDLESSEIVEETFDAVMVCNGHHSDQVIPDIPGLDKFKGVKTHSGGYRTFHPFEGKRVVVVGLGNSGGDLASELSHHAAQVYLSTRSGGYVFERMADTGTPYDMQLTRSRTYVPVQYASMTLTGLMNRKFDMELLGLKPTGPLWVTNFPICSDALPHRIMTGSIIVKGDVKRITETSVVFESDDEVDNIDVLLFCTGFNMVFPFAEEIIPVKEKRCTSLYKHVFLPDADHSTLAVIGALDIEGAANSVFEMQSRVACEVFAGRCSLPSKDVMLAEVAGVQTFQKKLGMGKTKMMRVGFVDYVDGLAEMIGARPDLWALFWKDPKLALRCFFGPCVPAQYRLQGPNSKDTRPIINSVDENYRYPLTNRKAKTSKAKCLNYNYLLLIFVAVVSIVWVLLV